ncbi:hypothetical protein [Bradyrhizobium sp. 200]|uniref:hypothetical protein n=1 Tax=Bradyrhizobium sp. 200 TaxID=2782665 RepID=UPI001FFF9DFB|nr:hypothetical protein [Bradyrhizobium sp. 200]
MVSIGGRNAQLQQKTVHPTKTAKVSHENASQTETELCPMEAAQAQRQLACQARGQRKQFCRADRGQSAARQWTAAWTADAGATCPAEIVDVSARIACTLSRQRRHTMMSWRMTMVLGSIGNIERILGKFRELIDTDDSISPELRGALHTTLDEHLLSERERLLKIVGEQ